MEWGKKERQSKRKLEEEGTWSKRRKRGKWGGLEDGRKER